MLTAGRTSPLSTAACPCSRGEGAVSPGCTSELCRQPCHGTGCSHRRRGALARRGVRHFFLGAPQTAFGGAACLAHSGTPRYCPSSRPSQWTLVPRPPSPPMGVSLGLVTQEQNGATVTTGSNHFPHPPSTCHRFVLQHLWAPTLSPNIPRSPGGAPGCPGEVNTAPRFKPWVRTEGLPCVWPSGQGGVRSRPLHLHDLPGVLSSPGGRAEPPSPDPAGMEGRG